MVNYLTSVVAAVVVVVLRRCRRSLIRPVPRALLGEDATAASVVMSSVAAPDIATQYEV